MKNTFSDHLLKEKEATLIEAWKYLKPWQKAWLYVRARWWSKPTILVFIKRVQDQFNIWLTYFLYNKAHWM